MEAAVHLKKHSGFDRSGIKVRENECEKEIK
jgi:hypothetical protein